MLADGDPSIAEVAHACGYSDHSAFCRLFKAAVDMTPTEFRAALRRAERFPPGLLRRLGLEHVQEALEGA